MNDEDRVAGAIYAALEDSYSIERETTEAPTKAELREAAHAAIAASGPRLTQSHRRVMFWLLGFVCGFFIGGMVEDAEAKYGIAAATQDEAAVTCGNYEARQRALEVARDLAMTRIRINANEHDPACDPIGAARDARAEGFSVHITLSGTPAYARRIVTAAGPVVAVWSTWNEPNHGAFHKGPMAAGMPRTYRRLHIRVARVVRKLDRTAKVWGFELAPQSNHESKWARSAAYRKGKPMLMDAVAIHGYSWFGDPGSKQGLRGNIRKWKRTVKQLSKQRRLCRFETTRRLQRKRCRPPAIANTEAGYMRELTVFWGAPIYDARTTAYYLVKAWQVACEEGLKQMVHYQLFSTQWHSWDTGLFNVHGPRAEYTALRGYIRSAQGCTGRAGDLGPESGPPPLVYFPAELPAGPFAPPPVILPPIIPDVSLPPYVPPVEPEVTPPTDPEPVQELPSEPPPPEPGPTPIPEPEPPVEPAVEEPVVPPIEEETP